MNAEDLLRVEAEMSGPGGGTEDKASLPAIDDSHALFEETIVTPPAIIDGLLRRGEKSVLGGSSKSFKSWCATDICISVAHGIPWLGRETVQGNVLLVNLELPRWCIRKRIIDVARARGITLEPNRLFVWTLRGESMTPERLREGLEKQAPQNLALICIDPSYKLLNGRDENAAGDVASLMNHFEAITTDTGAHTLVPTHFSKGNASGKDQQDRISGSGVFARDPDSILTLTRHESDDCFALEATLRTFPPVEPVVVRWQFPVFTVDATLDPAKLKRTRTGPQATFTKEKILALLPASGATKAEWRKLADARFGISKTGFYRLADELETAGLVTVNEDIYAPSNVPTHIP